MSQEDTINRCQKLDGVLQVEYSTLVETPVWSVSHGCARCFGPCTEEGSWQVNQRLFTPDLLKLDLLVIILCGCWCWCRFLVCRDKISAKIPWGHLEEKDARLTYMWCDTSLHQIKSYFDRTTLFLQPGEGLPATVPKLMLSALTQELHWTKMTPPIATPLLLDTTFSSYWMCW